MVECQIPVQVTRTMSMMAHAGILKSHYELLEEAIRHAVYLNERMIKSDRGEELLCIPVFGSVAWVHIDKDERQKHEERAELGLYVGEPQHHGKATHKVCLVESAVVVPTRHVEIWDGVFLNQILKSKGKKLPQGPVTPLGELGSGPSVLVQYDNEEEILKVKAGVEEVEDGGSATADIEGTEIDSKKDEGDIIETS